MPKSKWMDSVKEMMKTQGEVSETCRDELTGLMERYQAGEIKLAEFHHEIAMGELPSLLQERAHPFPRLAMEFAQYQQRRTERTSRFATRNDSAELADSRHQYEAWHRMMCHQLDDCLEFLVMFQPGPARFKLFEKTEQLINGYRAWYNDGQIPWLYPRASEGSGERTALDYYKNSLTLLASKWGVGLGRQTERGDPVSPPRSAPEQEGFL